MHFKAPGQLVERVPPLEGFQSHSRLECSTVLFAWSFHHCVTGYIMVPYRSPSKLPVQFFGSTIEIGFGKSCTKCLIFTNCTANSAENCPPNTTAEPSTEANRENEE